MKNVKLNDTTYEGISKVQLPTADGGTASFKDEDEIVEPVLKTGIEITPTTSRQEIDVPDGFDGFDAFAVKGVTAAIDPNITVHNIKKNVTILGVTGDLETGTTPVLDTPDPVVPTTADQTVSPRPGFDGLAAVTVKGVTSAIDANIVAEKIKKNVTILGVTGTFEGGGAPTPEWQVIDPELSVETGINTMLSNLNYKMPTIPCLMWILFDQPTASTQGRHMIGAFGFWDPDVTPANQTGNIFLRQWMVFRNQSGSSYPAYPVDVSDFSYADQDFGFHFETGRLTIGNNSGTLGLLVNRTTNNEYILKYAGGDSHAQTPWYQPGTKIYILTIPTNIPAPGGNA